MSEQAWTIDSIAHALPHPELRATFMRQATFTDVAKLPAILERWQRRVEAMQAAQPEIDRVRAYAETHDGETPSEYGETPESRAAWDEWEQSMREQQGHNAA